MAPPTIKTYHCLCTSLLLSSTHTLSNLPRRSSPPADSDSATPHPASDAAIILPLPSTPPLPPSSPVEGEAEDGSRNGTGNGNEEGGNLPSEGYTVLLGLLPDRKTTLIRRSDGFEKRILYRCSRCNLVVGYELQSASSLPTSSATDTNMDMDIDSGKGKSKQGEGDAGVYDGKILYILPGGVMSTEVLASGRKIGEEDVGFVGTGTGGRRAVGVFE